MKRKHYSFSKKFYWKKLLLKYNNLLIKVNELKTENKFDNLSNFEKTSFLKRIERLFEKIKRFGKNIGVKVAGTAFALILITNAATAQNYTHKGVLKSVNPMEIRSNLPASTFADINNDGVEELVLASYHGDIASFSMNNSNYLTANGCIQYNKDTLNFNSYSQPTPAFLDIDNDGDSDMFIGLKNGHINVYENNNGFDGLYSLNNKDFGNNIKICFADLNNDSHEDLFYGDKNGNILYGENDGSNNFPAFTNLTDTSGTNLDVENGSPSFMDIDNDGDLDLFIGTPAGKIHYFENDTLNEFIDKGNLQADNVDIDFTNQIFPTWYDFDNDGTKDLIIDSATNIFLFLNTSGNLSFDKKLTSDQLSLDDYYGKLNFADLDNSGNANMYLFANNKIKIYKNNGNSQFEFFENFKADGSDLYINSTAANYRFGDIDLDNDLDLLVGAGDTIAVYKNIAGTFYYSGNLIADGSELNIVGPNPFFANIANTQNPNLFISGNNDTIYVYTNNSGILNYDSVFTIQGDTICPAKFSFADVNNDNKTDFIYVDNDIIKTAINDGNGHFSYFDTLKNEYGIPIMDQITSDFVFYDLDKDGVKEFYQCYNYKIERYKSQFAASLKPITYYPDFSKIYSNKDNIFVELKDVKSAQLRIYNVSGKLILKKNIKNNRNKFNGFQRGLYIVKVYSEKGVNTKKVIVL